MSRGGRLAALSAVLLAALMLSVPAGAGAVGEHESFGTAALQSEESEEAEPELAGATDSTASADAPDSAGVEVVRYSAADQYELSIDLARALAETSGGASEWVVLASGTSWANAVVASPLAASLGAPVLLVPPGGLQNPSARPDLVEFLRSTGVRRVVIVSSPEVLPNHEPSVLFGLGMLPRNIERVHGTDPIGTALAVAERIGAPAVFGELGPTVIVASDRSVADAVAAGPLAAGGPFPLLLTAADALEPRIMAYLDTNDIAHVVLVGGTVAIAPAVQKSLEAAGMTVTRLAGRDRADTARLAADLFDQHTADDPACITGPTRLGLALAHQPEQALTAGPLLAQACTPLRYTEPDQLPPDLHNTLYLAQHRPAGAHVVAFADDQMIPEGLVRPAVPPVQVATWQFVDGRPSSEPEVVLVVIDERGNQISFPSTRMAIPRHTGLYSPYWHERLVWAPDGRWIAYRHATGHDLRVLDTTTGELVLLRFGDYVPRIDTGLDVEWSPDSSRLLFGAFIEDDATVSEFWADLLGERQPGSELFLFDVATEVVIRVTNNDWTEMPVQWSPDGKRFAYYSSHTPFTAGHLYARKVTLNVHNLDSGRSSPVHGSYSSLNFAFGSLWSPDGRRMAFSGTPPGEGVHWSTNELFVADYNGENLRQLTPSNCAECDVHRGDEIFARIGLVAVSWSPDSQRIVYHSDTSLQLHDLETGKGRVLLPPVQGAIPFELKLVDVMGWSNDGEAMYIRQYGDGCRISAFDINSQETEVLTDTMIDASSGGSTCGFRASISSDGSHFAVIYPRASMRLIEIQSGQSQQILNDWRSLETASNNPQIPLARPSSPLLGCSTEWTASGILGRCDFLLAPTGK